MKKNKLERLIKEIVRFSQREMYIKRKKHLLSRADELLNEIDKISEKEFGI